MNQRSEEKQFRHVSLEGCKVIGQGKHGRVYQLNDEQIIKIYHDKTAQDEIERERRNGREAFVQRVPSCITFDMVETEQGYGIIFELAGGRPLGSYITEHPDELEVCAQKFADLIRRVHTAKARPDTFGSAKQYFINIYREIPERFLSRSDIETLVRIIEAIPDSFSLLHNDLHTQNVMIDREKNMMLIDMAEITYGHPIFDLGCTYMTMIFSPKLSRKLGKQIIGLSKKDARKVWDIMIRRYLCTEDEGKIREFEKLCKKMRNLRLATLIVTTSVFSEFAYRVCALWTKFFVIRHADAYIEAFRNLGKKDTFQFPE